jgi:thymidylate synthase (FAD)
MTQVINPSYEILEYPERVLERIERAARTCYKSEDKITEGSAEKLVRSLMKRGHMAMIEFGGSASVRFISNRGFTHEMVRHRLCSFGQESTRYCNYGKGKFGGEITVCDPTEVLFMREPDLEKRARWKLKMLSSWARAEEDYLDLVNDGCPAELSREVLPIGVKAEIVVEANVREWRNIFSQRASHLAHPRMRELMIPLVFDFAKKMPVIFDDLVPKERGPKPKTS